MSATTNKALWHCHCGCYTWKILENGTMQCANCEKVTNMEESSWQKLPPVPKKPPTASHPIHSTNVSYGLMKRHFLNNFKEDDDVAIIIKKDGGVKTYGVCEPHLRNWLVDRLETAFKLLMGK